MTQSSQQIKQRLLVIHKQAFIEKEKGLQEGYQFFLQWAVDSLQFLNAKVGLSQSFLKLFASVDKQSAESESWGKVGPCETLLVFGHLFL